MNLHTLSAFALSLAAVGAISGKNQTLRANIPFSFVANGASLPAGEYTVQPNSPLTATTMIIRGAGHSVEAITLAAEASTRLGTARLVFHRYGNRYFLFQIWTDDDQGNQLPPTRFEREIITHGSAPGESVVVALR